MSERTFYNNEFKQNFLKHEKDNGQNISLFVTIFEKSQEIETQSGRDLYTFSDKNIMKVLQSFGYISIVNFYNYKAKIKQYLTYAYKKGVTSEMPQNTLEDLTYVNLGFSDDFYNKYYRDYDHMIETFESVMGGSTSITTIRIKILISLVFWGIPKDDLLDLTADDCNFVDQTIYSKTLKEHIKMPSEVINLCIASANERQFKDEDGRKTEVFDSKNVIKLKTNTLESNIEPSKIITSTFKTFVKTWKENVEKMPMEIQPDYINKTFTLKNIEKNGFIYRVYQKEVKAKTKYLSNAECVKAAEIKNPSTGYSYWKLYMQWKRAYNL